RSVLIMAAAAAPRSDVLQPLHLALAAAAAHRAGPGDNEPGAACRRGSAVSGGDASRRGAELSLHRIPDLAVAFRRGAAPAGLIGGPGAQKKAALPGGARPTGV